MTYTQKPASRLRVMPLYSALGIGRILSERSAMVVACWQQEVSPGQHKPSPSLRAILRRGPMAGWNRWRFRCEDWTTLKRPWFIQISPSRRYNWPIFAPGSGMTTSRDVVLDNNTRSLHQCLSRDGVGISSPAAPIPHTTKQRPRPPCRCESQRTRRWRTEHHHRS